MILCKQLHTFAFSKMQKICNLDCDESEKNLHLVQDQGATIRLATSDQCFPAGGHRMHNLQLFMLFQNQLYLCRRKRLCGIVDSPPLSMGRNEYLLIIL